MGVSQAHSEAGHTTVDEEGTGISMRVQEAKTILVLQNQNKMKAIPVR